MGSQRSDLTEEYVVISSPFELIWQSIVGFIDLKEFFVSLWIVRIIFGMVFQGQLSVSLFEVFNWSVSRNSKNLVVVLGPFRVMGVKEFFLFFINDPVLSKEVFEGIMGIFQRKF